MELKLIFLKRDYGEWDGKMTINYKGVFSVPDENWIKRKRRMRKDGENNNND